MDSDRQADLVDADQDLAAGTVVGEYEVQRELGRGGFGVVYAGLHPLIGKSVAIKVLHRKYSADAAIVSRFVSEARAVNQIRHQHIIDIFSFGKLGDGRQYYVMELLDGEPLNRLLEGPGRLPPGEALAILRPIARALDAAHAAGIVHRDLKADNVFVAIDSEGRPFPKLLDFGIAKLFGQEHVPGHRTGTGVPLGTPLYMSPEQANGKTVDHRTDIYSFGILCYQVLTGEMPFTGSSYMEILTKQVHDVAAPPSTWNSSLPAAVDDAIATMIAKDPEDRPSSVTAAVDGLAAAVGVDTATPAALRRPSRDSAAPPRKGAPTVTDASMIDPMGATVAPVTGEGVTQPGARRGGRGGVIAAALAALVAACVIAWIAWPRSEPKQQPPPTRQPAPAVVPLDAPPAPVVVPDAAPEPAAEVMPDAGALPKKKPPKKKPPKGHTPQTGDELGDF